MKHTLLTILLAVCSLAASAQTPKFFGIPVDGTPSSFVAKLQKSGMNLTKLFDKDMRSYYEVPDFPVKAYIIVYHNKNLTNSVDFTVPNMLPNDPDFMTYYDVVFKKFDKDHGLDNITQLSGEDAGEGLIDSVLKYSDTFGAYLYITAPDKKGHLSIVYSVANKINEKNGTK